MEPIDRDLSLRTPGKSLLVVGAIAGVVPFVITMSSASSSTVNGRVVAFHYRDWLAVGGARSPCCAECSRWSPRSDPGTRAARC